MRNNLLPIIAQFCNYSGLNRFCSPTYGGLGLILMFHRFVSDPSKRIDNSGMVSDMFFDKLLGYIRARGPEIIRLCDVPQAIAEKRKFICLTMDDGYRDNKEIALPILRRHNAPATIFIPSGVLDRSMEAWWLQLEEKAKCEDNPQQAYLQMVTEISLNPDLLDDARKSFILSQHDLNDRYYLNESEVAEMARDPLIDIGGHSVTHPFLKRQSEEDAYREISQNKRELERLLGEAVTTFAYPFGHADACGAREYELARKAGYDIAVTTRDGNIFPEHASHLTALPRYNVRGQFEQLAIFNMQKSGAYRALRSRFGAPFVTE